MSVTKEPGVSTELPEGFVPLEGVVFLEPLDEEAFTGDKKSRLIKLPTKKERSVFCRVISVGPDKVLENGVTMPSSVQTGDTVIVSEYGGQFVDIDHKTFRAVNMEDLLAVVR